VYANNALAGHELSGKGNKESGKPGAEFLERIKAANQRRPGGTDNNSQGWQDAAKFHLVLSPARRSWRCQVTTCRTEQFTWTAMQLYAAQPKTAGTKKRSWSNATIHTERKKPRR
jgi:hypothetical protein